MKLNSAQIEQTLDQLDAEPIPTDHPLMPRLEGLFGDHTYFLNSRGLNIVEPIERENQEGLLGVVVNLANWADSSSASLAPHEPESTDVMVMLDADRPN